MRFIGTVAAVGVAALLLAGCNPGTTSSGQQEASPPVGSITNPAERKMAETDLQQIALAYQICHDVTGKPPSKPEDLFQYMEGPQGRASQGVTSGKYIVYSNVKLVPADPKISNMVVAYYKDVPTAGGLVAMGDGKVKTMTADQFKAIAPAGQ